MKRFLHAMMKTAFLVMALIGLLSVGIGVVLYLYPDVLFQILRWGCIGALIFGGVVFTMASFCGYAIARKGTSNGKLNSTESGINGDEYNALNS